METLDVLSPPLPGETAHRLTVSAGLSIHYRVLRSPAPARGAIVLLHGAASNLTRWSEFVEHTSLKSRFDILRLDLRGHGDSFTRGCLGLRKWNRDLLAILDQERIDRAILVGHSLGAQAALHFAARHPERTAGLALIDPVFRAALQPRWRLLALLSPLTWPLVWGARLLNSLGIHRRHIPQRDLRALDEETRQILLASGKQAEMVTKYSSPWLDLQFFPTANYLAVYLEMLRPIPDLRHLATPTIVMLSSAITFTDLPRMRELAAGLPIGEVIDLPSSHWPLTEKPREVRAAIEEWVARRFG